MTNPEEPVTSTSYEPCVWCKSARAKGDLQRALQCKQCGGVGIVAKGPACNGCGGSLYPMVPEGNPNGQIVHGLSNVQLVGGCDSEGLLDNNRYTFSLCERCIRTMILMKCKLPPRVERLGAGALSWEPVAFADDQETWDYAEWKRQGGHATARLHRQCNATIHCGGKAIYSVMFSGKLSDDCLCEEHKDRFKFTVNATLVPFVPWGLSAEDEAADA